MKRWHNGIPSRNNNNWCPWEPKYTVPARTRPCGPPWTRLQGKNPDANERRLVALDSLQPTFIYGVDQTPHFLWKYNDLPPQHPLAHFINISRWY